MTVGEMTFCETISASLTHIRVLGPAGRRPTGGADTPALCEARVLWDTGLTFSHEAVLDWDPWPYRLCPTCRRVYLETAGGGR